VHGVEGGPVHAIGEQGRLQRVGPAPPVVQHDGFALGSVEGRGQRDRHRLPARQLGVVGRLASGGIGVIGQAPDHGHGQRLDGAVGTDHVRGEPGGHVAVEAGPGRRSGEAQVGDEALLLLGHLMIGGHCGPAQRMGVGGGLVATGDEGLGSEPGHPGREPVGQAGHVGELGLETGSATGGVVVARVGAGERVQVGADESHPFQEVVGGAHYFVEGGQVGVGRGAGVPAAHVVAVVEGDKSGQVGHYPLVIDGQLATVKGWEEGGHVPAREGFGHRALYQAGAPPWFWPPSGPFQRMNCLGGVRLA